MGCPIPQLNGIFSRGNSAEGDHIIASATPDTVIRASITDPNYDFKAWSQKPAGGTLSGNATNGTFKLTAKSTSVKGPTSATPDTVAHNVTSLYKDIILVRVGIAVFVDRNGDHICRPHSLDFGAPLGLIYRDRKDRKRYDQGYLSGYFGPDQRNEGS